MKKTEKHSSSARRGPKSHHSNKGGRSYKRDGTPPKGGKKIQADLWGVHAVEAAWLNPQREITALYATDKALAGMAETMKEARTLGLKRPEPQILDRKSFDRRLPQAVHQGLAIEAAPLPEVFVTDLIAKTSLKGKGLIVMLDQVTDPHNVGAILRSVSAFGGDGLIMQTRHAPGITGVLAKTATGAVEHTPIAYETNLGRALSQLQEAGFKAVALDERGKKTIAEIKPQDKTVLILGSEGKGLRQHLQEESDQLVRLPTQGPIYSLNVSNAAAVALYALASSASVK